MTCGCLLQGFGLFLLLQAITVRPISNALGHAGYAVLAQAVSCSRLLTCAWQRLPSGGRCARHCSTLFK